MAITNSVKTRIQLKNDTEINWRRAINFSPLKGELIIYLPDEAHPFSRLKVGDGSANVNDLPFLSTESSIQCKSTQEWNLQRDFIPKDGELIIYNDKIINDTTKIPGIKVGDGVTFLIDLPFINDDIRIDLNNHINDSSIHVTPEEKNFWNNKINCEEVIDEELIFNRL